jgi:hypothetical protein
VTPQPPHDFYPRERPVRSEFAFDYELERSYARRRVITVTVLVLILIGAAYGIWGRGPANPADIPTIKAEGAYKQKPAEPGGIDIPHQDVQVYDALENKGAPPSQVEHLLPLPEVPQNVPHAAPVAALPPAPPPSVVPKADIILSSAAPAPAASTVGLAPVAPAPVAPPAPAPVAAKAAPVVATSPPENLTIEQVIKETQGLTPTKAPPASPSVVASASKTAPAPTAPPAATGPAAVQLASVTDEGAAQTMMQTLQRKYAAQLGGAVLHLARADLGARGIYYRIQSQSLAEDEANRICSALKQMNAGCILVRK